MAFTYIRSIIKTVEGGDNMVVIKKVLIYLAHRQAQKQAKVRKLKNRQQIKLILQDL